MKILFILPEFLPQTGGGIITYYQHLLPELVSLGHQVHVYVGSPFSTKLEDYEVSGITVRFLDPSTVTNRLDHFGSYKALPELQRHLASAWAIWEQVNEGQNYDIIDTTDWGLLFVPWIVEEDSPPTIVQLHGSIGQIDYYDPLGGDELKGHLTRLLEVQLLSFADELQAHSTNNANEWNRLTNRKIHYSPPAWSPHQNTYTLSERTPNGLVVGRIQYWKGPIVLCEAMRLLGKTAPVIDWIGRDTTYIKASESMSAYLSQNFPDVWGSKVRPVGPCSPEETARRQALAAFCVIPSVWDVFNFTCVEEMGCGQAVICSTGAGASGLIKDGENGLPFPANDAEALAGKLEQLLSMTTVQRESMGRAARETILSTLNPAVVAEHRIKRYESLIARGRHLSRLPAWVTDSVRPHEPLSNPLAFLDNLPLRELSRYTLRRGLRHILN